jgi:hypothetical protein
VEAAALGLLLFLSGDLILEYGATGRVNPYLIGIAVIRRALELKRDQRAHHRHRINTALPSLLRSSGPVSNSPEGEGGPVRLLDVGETCTCVAPRLRMERRVLESLQVS